MKLTTKERLQTARHEAGHVLLHILKNVPFVEVWIEQGHISDTMGAVANCDRDFYTFTLEQFNDEAIISMAGLAGERVGRSCGSTWRGDYSVGCVVGDLDRIQYIYDAMEDPERPYPNDKDYDRWLRAAHDALTQHSDAHKRIVDALMERGRLSYDECVALVGLTAPAHAAAAVAA